MVVDRASSWLGRHHPGGFVSIRVLTCSDCAYQLGPGDPGHREVTKDACIIRCEECQKTHRKALREAKKKVVYGRFMDTPTSSPH